MMFSESEQTTIVNALRVAAEQYRKDADLMREAGQQTLARQFDMQAEACVKLANENESTGWEAR